MTDRSSLLQTGEILPPQSNGHFADFEQILQNNDFNSAGDLLADWGEPTYGWAFDHIRYIIRGELYHDILRYQRPYYIIWYLELHV